MNLANRITIARLFLIPVFVIAYLLLPNTSILPGVLFVVASLTDFLDGYIARSRNMVTTFGKFMDPLVDKVLTISAFILLAEKRLVSGYIVVIIVGRELLITGFRTIAASEGVTIAASKWGKLKTTFQMLAVVALLWQNLLPDKNIGEVFIYLALIFTIISGWDYLRKNIHVLDLDNA